MGIKQLILLHQLPVIPITEIPLRNNPKSQHLISEGLFNLIIFVNTTDSLLIQYYYILPYVLRVEITFSVADVTRLVSCNCRFEAFKE